MQKLTTQMRLDWREQPDGLALLPSGLGQACVLTVDDLGRQLYKVLVGYHTRQATQEPWMAYSTGPYPQVLHVVYQISIVSC
jgi:hypothetical protein